MDEKEKSNFDTMKQDPEYVVSLINKYVQVNVIKNTSFEGFLHCIDPVTNSTIISVPKGTSYETKLLPGHGILDIKEVTPPINVTPPVQNVQIKSEPTELLNRKSKLIGWLKENLLPATEEGENIRMGSVLVLPPYDVMSIYAENTMVAMQIRNLIENMPEDFVPGIKSYFFK